MSDTLYNYAKFEYDCGNYGVAAEYLYFYQLLVNLWLLCEIRELFNFCLKSSFAYYVVIVAII